MQKSQKSLDFGIVPRNAQFEYINQQVIKFQKEKQPVISVDTKKKELIGNFKNNGQEWWPKGEPEEVNMHDFLIKELGRGIPYGVYDILLNRGWVSVGTDKETAEFAVETICRWWKLMGKLSCNNATKQNEKYAYKSHISHILLSKLSFLKFNLKTSKNVF